MRIHAPDWFSYYDEKMTELEDIPRLTYDECADASAKYADEKIIDLQAYRIDMERKRGLEDGL